MSFHMLEVRMEKTAGVLLVPLVRVNMQRRRLHKGKQQRHVRQQAGEDTQQTLSSYLKPAAACPIRGPWENCRLPYGAPSQ